MKVKELIRELKKYPQDIEVYYSSHDNSTWEIQGDICSINHLDKRDYFAEDDPDNTDITDKPAEWLTIRG